MCVSRASSLETRSEHAVRRPRSTSRPCAAATASSEGIGARDPPAARSLMHTAVAPPAARSAHASATRSTAAERPSSASKVASTSAGSSAASPSGVTRNDGSATSDASGPSASIGARGPTSVATDITARSRSWSIAGFVTCAKRCRKYDARGRARPASGAIGASSPIE